MQELVEPIRRLLGQLTTKEVEFDMEVLQKIVPEKPKKDESQEAQEEKMEEGGKE